MEDINQKNMKKAIINSRYKQVGINAELKKRNFNNKKSHKKKSHKKKSHKKKSHKKKSCKQKKP